MRNIIANFWRNIFKIGYFRKKYFGFHQHLFSPYHLFKNVRKQILYRNSIKLNLDLEDWIQQQIYFLGDYEKPEIDFLYQTLRKGDVFIDIGANIGLFSLNASVVLGERGKIYAFEAYLPNYKILEKHVKTNNFRNIITENLAISDRKSTLEIKYNENERNLGMASAYLKNFTSTLKVSALSLDDYATENEITRIDFIKMDIEGGEFKALQGMTNILRMFSPKLLIEINSEALESTGHSESDILDILDNFNYGKTLVLSQNENSYNALFECTVC
ncbi:FkbM family methyltransferase [Chryseobacterium sp.]|uniref:FkbM family methyltransferase n=1 Tax=Chryseobacterium sp. TaxID=1871047 RepID=UPI0011C99219|nr:FkbM family methyltransferase [Chryseobacterium sp.]TXF76167.1 FkbM family methyltransferase [Chryseobacterium sp.]